MSLPTIVQLGKGEVALLRYETGNLWYQVQYNCDRQDCEVFHFFDFPVPVDLPELYASVRKEISYIKAAIHESKTDVPAWLHDRLDVIGYTIDGAEKRGAAGGPFPTTGKGLTFLRWIRPHLEMLREAEKAQADR